jgi:preprotein translocase subunit SecB
MADNENGKDGSTVSDPADNPIPAERFTEDPAQAPAPTEERLVVTGQYVSDLSFEAPNAPDVFMLLQNEMPNIPISIDLNAEPKGGNNFEVQIKVRAEAKVGDTVAYIAEIAYAGLFQINVPQEELGPVLMIDCPLILFPFLRKIISDVTSDGGFAPLMLAPMDFAALYIQKMNEQQAASEA